MLSCSHAPAPLGLGRATASVVLSAAQPLAAYLSTRNSREVARPPQSRPAPASR